MRQGKQAHQGRKQTEKKRREKKKKEPGLRPVLEVFQAGHGCSRAASGPRDSPGGSPAHQGRKQTDKKEERKKKKNQAWGRCWRFFRPGMGARGRTERAVTVGLLPGGQFGVPGARSSSGRGWRCLVRGWVLKSGYTGPPGGPGSWSLQRGARAGTFTRPG